MGRHRFRLAAVLGIALAASLAGASDSRAAVLFFDDFNSENQSLNYTGFANWSVPSGSVDLIGAGGLFDFYPGNGNYVDLNGSTETIGQLKSNIVFGAGTYTLNFLLGGSTGGSGGADPISKTTLITLGDFTTQITLAPNAGLISQSFTFSTAGGNLIFASLSGGNPNVGNILDNVQVSSAVPELSSWFMMLFGFGGVGLWAYGRTKKTTTAFAVA